MSIGKSAEELTLPLVIAEGLVGDTVTNLPCLCFLELTQLTPPLPSEEDPHDSEPIGAWDSPGSGYRPWG